MPTPKWQSGTAYPTGSLVQPLTATGATSAVISNAGFESGGADWTFGAGMAVSASGVYAGTNSLRCTGTAGLSVALHDEVGVNPGQSITATCMYQQGAASSGRNVGRVFLRWFTIGMVQIGADSDGSAISSSSGGYKQSTVTAIAPPTAAYVSIGGKVVRDASQASHFDNFAWNYAVSTVPAGLIYKAVQPALGTSDSTEPTWPLTVGVQVVDGTVIWEAIVATRVTWRADPILLSGDFEPAWPLEVGAFIVDNTISWKTVPRQAVEAPQSKVVTIASSKVYAADDDIVRYSVTVNPLDWTSVDDAGYLATGLNQFGSNRTAVLNTYRGNVVSFSASTFQNWQVDPDPANITLLDSMEGIGSTYQQAAHPVANDLFYLSPLGVRTVGIAAGTSNLAAGDAGAPIDPLVQAALLPEGVRPLAAYYPNQGQYWLCMRPPLPIVLGPTISGFAPDGTEGAAYPGFAYTITPGDAAIDTVLITDGALPPSVSMDNAGVLDTAITTTPGDFGYELTATDLNGLAAVWPDEITVLDATGNYWNPADTATDITLSNASRTAASDVLGTAYQKTRAFGAKNSGKWYFEVQGTFHPDTYDNGRVGVDPPSAPLTNAVGQIGSWAIQSNGFRRESGALNPVQMTPPLPGSNVIQVAWDADTGKLWYGVNNVWGFGGDPVAGTNPSSTGVFGPMLPASNMVSGGLVFNYTISTTPAQCAYTPPTGFSRWYP